MPLVRKTPIDPAVPFDPMADGKAETVVAVSPNCKTANGSILNIAGALADSKTFAEDSVERIRKTRDEW